MSDEREDAYKECFGIVAKYHHGDSDDPIGDICEEITARIKDRQSHDSLRALLVKACARIAKTLQWNGVDAHVCESEIFEDYGIRLRWTGSTFEEDTTK